MTVTVEVLQHHIDAGLRGFCRLCPVALALYRATGEVWEVKPRYACRISGGRGVPLPPKVATFIRRFDRGEECHPFNFTVEVPV